MKDETSEKKDDIKYNPDKNLPLNNGTKPIPLNINNGSKALRQTNYVREEINKETVTHEHIPIFEAVKNSPPLNTNNLGNTNNKKNDQIKPITNTIPTTDNPDIAKDVFEEPLNAPIFKLGRLIGSGAFGILRLCTDVSTEKLYAVKLEAIDAKQPQLHKEYQTYWKLHHNQDVEEKNGATEKEMKSTDKKGNETKMDEKTNNERFYTNYEKGKKLRPIGFPKIYYFGECTNRYNALVMDLLGPNLQELFVMMDKKFSLKTVLLIAFQTLDRIEFLHRKGIIYRDVKPQNFLIGRKSEGMDNLVYLLDFGLSKEYVMEDGKHIPFLLKKSLTGTARYISINTHEGVEQSRRDDIESLSYLYLYFLKGSLPWQNMTDHNRVTNKERYRLIGLKKRDSVSSEEFFINVPSEFRTMLTYARNIAFDECPDYDFIRELLMNLFNRLGYTCDNIFDWNSGNFPDNRDGGFICKKGLFQNIPMVSPNAKKDGDPAAKNINQQPQNRKNDMKKAKSLDELRRTGELEIIRYQKLNIELIHRVDKDKKHPLGRNTPQVQGTKKETTVPENGEDNNVLDEKPNKTDFEIAREILAKHHPHSPEDNIADEVKSHEKQYNPTQLTQNKEMNAKENCDEVFKCKRLEEKRDTWESLRTKLAEEYSRNEKQRILNKYLNETYPIDFNIRNQIIKFPEADQVSIQTLNSVYMLPQGPLIDPKLHGPKKQIAGFTSKSMPSALKPLKKTSIHLKLFPCLKSCLTNK